MTFPFPFFSPVTVAAFSVVNTYVMTGSGATASVVAEAGDIVVAMGGNADAANNRGALTNLGTAVYGTGNTPISTYVYAHPISVSGTTSVGWVSNNADNTAVIAVLRGLDSTGQSNGTVRSSTAVTTLPFNAVTTVAGGYAISFAICDAGSTITNDPSGYTAIEDNGSSTTYANIRLAYKQVAGSSETPGSVTISSSNDGRTFAIFFPRAS